MQVYNVVVARSGTVVVELGAATTEFHTPAAVPVLMSNHMVARAVPSHPTPSNRTQTLGFDANLVSP